MDMSGGGGGGGFGESSDDKDDDDDDNKDDRPTTPRGGGGAGEDELLKSNTSLSSSGEWSEKGMAWYGDGGIWEDINFLWCLQLMGSFFFFRLLFLFVWCSFTSPKRHRDLMYGDNQCGGFCWPYVVVVMESGMILIMLQAIMIISGVAILYKVYKIVSHA